jgi:hypothetical protein
VTLTTHPHLEPRSRMIRNYTPSPPSAFVACSGAALVSGNLITQRAGVAMATRFESCRNTDSTDRRFHDFPDSADDWRDRELKYAITALKSLSSHHSQSDWLWWGDTDFSELRPLWAYCSSPDDCDVDHFMVERLGLTPNLSTREFW